jgi:hypothetical protein
LALSLAQDLSVRFGRGFSRQNFQRFRKSHLSQPKDEIRSTRSGKLPDEKRATFFMKLLRFLLASAFFVSLDASAQTAASPTPEPLKGLRVFTVGHSFHAWVSPLIAQLAASAGIQRHNAQVMGLGGSRVLDCWAIPKPGQPKQPETNTAKDALTAGTVDVLTLSPIWMPDEGIDDFAQLGLAHNPSLRITVQEFWMPNDTYEPKYPLDVHKQPTVDHDAVDLTALAKAQSAYDHDVEAYVAGVNQKLGKDAIAIVPVGRAAVALREKIVAGQAPGIEKQSELFHDPWGHPMEPLKVLSAYCHYAVIYRRSPVGLPMPPLLRGKYNNEALNRLLQELAWQAVTSCPMSEVKE